MICSPSRHCLVALKIKENKTKLRQLALQAVGISNDIREHYASLDGLGVNLPKNMVDAISELELYVR